jgi:hypothetical protein
MAADTVMSGIPEITGLRTRVRRPERNGGAHNEKEKGESCFSMASPDTVLHASTPHGHDFFLTHRPPPFMKITLNFFLEETVQRRNDPRPKPIGCRVMEFPFCRSEFR